MPLTEAWPRFHSAYLLKCGNGAAVHAYVSAQKLAGAHFDTIRSGSFQPMTAGLLKRGSMSTPPGHCLFIIIMDAVRNVKRPSDI